MQFYFFHLMPWPYLPADFDERHSAWVDLSNANYDPVRGHQLYNDYLDQLAAAEGLGFDGVCVNEHHQNTYGTMPAPNIIATSSATRSGWSRSGSPLPTRAIFSRRVRGMSMLAMMFGAGIVP